MYIHIFLSLSLPVYFTFILTIFEECRDRKPVISIGTLWVWI